MDKNNTISNYIVENFLFGDSGHLNENTDLFRESIIDSTGILELIAFIETTFDVSINDEEIIQDNFSSITAIKNFLQTKQIKVTNPLCAE